MDKRELENRIQNLVKQRRGKVVALHTIKAMFGIFPNPVGTLGSLFFGVKEAIDQEKHQIEQDIILDLLCKIDENISEAMSKAKENLPKKSLIVLGDIVAYGKDANSVTGVSISDNSGPVELKPGTKIIASGEKVRNITGLKIGSNKNKEDGK